MNSSERTIRARVGEPVTISIPANPTTGYLWLPSYNEAELTLQARRFDLASRAIGAGGHENFTFVPRIAGQLRISFGLRRPNDEADKENIAYLLDVSSAD